MDDRALDTRNRGTHSTLPDPSNFFSLGRQKFYPVAYLPELLTFDLKEPVPENADGAFSLSALLSGVLLLNIAKKENKVKGNSFLGLKPRIFLPKSL